MRSLVDKLTFCRRATRPWRRSLNCETTRSLTSAISSHRSFPPHPYSPRSRIISTESTSPRKVRRTKTCQGHDQSGMLQLQGVRTLHARSKPRARDQRPAEVPRPAAGALITAGSVGMTKAEDGPQRSEIDNLMYAGTANEEWAIDNRSDTPTDFQSWIATRRAKRRETGHIQLGGQRRINYAQYRRETLRLLKRLNQTIHRLPLCLAMRPGRRRSADFLSLRQKIINHRYHQDLGDTHIRYLRHAHPR